MLRLHQQTDDVQNVQGPVRVKEGKSITDSPSVFCHHRQLARPGPIYFLLNGAFLSYSTFKPLHNLKSIHVTRQISKI